MFWCSALRKRCLFLDVDDLNFNVVENKPFLFIKNDSFVDIFLLIPAGFNKCSEQYDQPPYSNFQEMYMRIKLTLVEITVFAYIHISMKFT